MESIWSPNGTFTSVVTTYANGFDNKMTTVSETLNGIKDLIASMVKDAEEKANEQHAKDTSAGGATPSTPAPSTPGTNAGSFGGSSNGADSSNGSGGSNGSNGDWGSWFIYKKDSFPKGSLNTETSIIDRLKYRNIDSAFSARAGYYAAMGGSGSYVGSASQNRWMISQMKQHGYKVGSRNIPYDQNNWIHEGEIVYRPADGAMMMPLQAGGTVFTKEQVEKLWDMSKNGLPTSAMQKLDFDLPAASKNQTINVGGVECRIELPNVTNASEFAEQFKQVFDKDIGNIRKMIDTSVNGRFGSMEYRKFLK